MQPGSVRELTVWEINFSPETESERSQQTKISPSEEVLSVGPVLDDLLGHHTGLSKQPGLW